MSFVNVNGEPIDLQALMRRVAADQRLMRPTGYPKRKATVKRGYAAQPGTGPEGKRCADCAHKHSFSNVGGGKHFIKCELRRATWTRGEGTDILAGTPACSKFEERKL